MNKIELWLVAFSDIGSMCLSTNKNEFCPPFIEVSSSKTLEQSLKELCREFLTLDFVWLNPFLVLAENNYSEDVTLIYGALIPPGTDIKAGYFVKIPAHQSNLFNQIVKKYA